MAHDCRVVVYRISQSFVMDARLALNIDSANIALDASPPHAHAQPTSGGPPWIVAERLVGQG
jgi:hypothetical protein